MCEDDETGASELHFERKSFVPNGSNRNRSPRTNSVRYESKGVLSDDVVDDFVAVPGEPFEGSVF